MWNKGAAGVLAATRAVEEELPFALLGFDCDNGSEFLNHHLLGYLHERKKPVAFTRSRPYHSDDNAHFEQKNWMWPRQLLGCGLYDVVGNVWEVCSDICGPLTTDHQTDPHGPDVGDVNVIRGGSWAATTKDDNTRLARRGQGGFRSAEPKAENAGFRCVRSIN